jgi:hypothetical protein
MSTTTLSKQSSPAGWSARLRDDRRRAVRNQASAQRAITEELLARALDRGVESFALTGSTARRRRTTISDLDYHIIGPRPETKDLPAEVDIVAMSSDRLHTQLLEGDDFAQWTLRCGCILHDTGPMREAVELIDARELWPSASRKLKSLPDHCREAERLLTMADRDAAQQQIRAMLTTAARGLLLAAGVFPLARSELPRQLVRLGDAAIASQLEIVIRETPQLPQLAAMLKVMDEALRDAAAPAAA